MSKIKSIKARQVLDSRGNPTVEVDVMTEAGNLGRAAVPSGASTGTREALELRDGDKSYYLGRSVRKAIDNVHAVMAPKLLNLDVFDQQKNDAIMLELDGTEFKSKLGANGMLAVSMAMCRAGALDKSLSLFKYLNEHLRVPTPDNKMRMPAPLMNIINGGQHASNNLDIQEFMILPRMNKSFSENIRAGVEVFHSLKSILSKKNHTTNVGDEGGFAPDLKSHEEALDLIMEAISSAGYKPGDDIAISLDSASSEFFADGAYTMQGKKFSTDDMISFYEKLIKNYPIYSIEDGLAEADHSGWTKMTSALGSKILTVGDDLFVTNKKILDEGIKNKEANSILVKVNQIGTITETCETMELAYKNDMKCIVSHRSGETGDAFIADLAVATGAGHIKTGSASRSDRMEKYNQLLRIEEELGRGAIFDPVKLK